MTCRETSILEGSGSTLFVSLVISSLKHHVKYGSFFAYQQTLRIQTLP